jgi:hypothetical protein
MTTTKDEVTYLEDEDVLSDDVPVLGNVQNIPIECYWGFFSRKPLNNHHKYKTLDGTVVEVCVVAEDIDAYRAEGWKGLELDLDNPILVKKWTYGGK